MQRRNNIEPVHDMGVRNAQKLAVKKYEGSCSLDFVLAAPWFFYPVTGGSTTSGGGPYTHTFAETDTIPSITIENDVSLGTKHVSKLRGCKVASMTITCAINEVVRVKLDILFANETVSTTTSAVVTETLDLYVFQQGTLEIPNGTSIADVQSCEITFNNNPEYVWGIGSRFAQQGPIKHRQHSGRATLAFETQAQIMDLFYGGSTGPIAAPAETATMELLFDNGLTGTNQRYISLIYTGLQFDEHNLPQDPQNLILEDVTFTMRSVSITALNNTTTIP